MALAFLVLLPLGGVALAKEPIGVTITGPGLDGPIEISGVLVGPIEISGVVEADSNSEFSEFVEAIGFFDLLFGSNGQPLPEEIEPAPRGPVYVVTWDMGVEIPTEVYPLAPGGPLVHLEPGLYRSEAGNSYRSFGVRGGWFRADPVLLDLLAGFGVPVDKIAVPEGPASKLETESVAEPLPILKPPESKAEPESFAQPLPIPEADTPGSTVPIGGALAGVGLVVAGAAAIWVMGKRPRPAGTQ